MQASFETIRTNLRRFILENGYPSVERFAHENAIDKTTLSRILNGKREPRLSTLIRIAESLNLTLNDFYLKSESVQTPLRQAGDKQRILTVVLPDADAKALQTRLGSKSPLVMELKFQEPGDEVR
jgi:transcriptional regulator with XRE-family HTH domain